MPLSAGGERCRFVSGAARMREGFVELLAEFDCPAGELRQDFVELDAAPGGVRARLQRGFRGARRRRMQELDGVGEGDQSLPAAPFCIEQLIEIGLRQRRHDELAQGVLGDAGRRRIDGRQRLRQSVIAGDNAVARMHHFRAEKAVPDLTEDTHAAAVVTRLLQLLGLATVEVEKAQRQFAARIGNGCHELAARAELHRDIEHFGIDLHRYTGHGLADQGDAGFVLVA